MLPIDLTSLLHDGLREGRREDDGLLHCSSDLCGSLRHTQLRLAGGPTMESELLGDIRMHTGTMWHRDFEDMFRKANLAVMTEVNVTPWLPEGWGGIADWLIWNPKLNQFVLTDLKTTKGEGIRFIKEQGAKKEHMWQASAYLMALKNGGFPMADRFVIYYLPMNDTVDRNEEVEPLAMLCEPVDSHLLLSELEYRRERTRVYLNSLPEGEVNISELVTSELEPTLDREQKVYWNSKMDVFDLKLTPHWLTRYCPFPLELCDCSEQKAEKIGHYTLEKKYVPRSGYSDIEPSVVPSQLDYEKRRNK